ncbi:MAG: N-acetylmuramoyl-L-alanine amidase, partial [Myxococcota bacterium]|nr:N-acetylmuramoyl-L-alanine amidase [Myxococcota bacterium]
YADGWVMVPSGTNPFELGGYIFTEANDEVTARARFTAELPAAGSYGVHISWSAGVDRAEDVLVEVHHAGGVDKILVDQKNHGGTWVYLGLFDFQMTGGEVVITNQSTSVGQIVTADAVRFGGGVGLIDRGTGDYPAAGQTTGRPRFESCARYHAQFCGAPATVYDNSSEDSKDDVGARSRYAAWQHPDGEDAVFVSWHSNAPNPGTGTSTWVYGPDGPGSPYEFTGTAGSEQLAQAVHAQFINSIRDAWDPDWKDRGVRSAWFGELSPYSNPEMPSVLVETAFHDTPSDAALLLEPHFRFTLARAYLKGLIDYFAARDGVVAMYPPLAPEDLVVQGLPDGDIRVHWSPVTDATSYRIWTSEDGVGFRFEKEVNTSDAELSAEHHVSLAVRVTAVSEAGESFPSTTLSVMPACTEKRALLVSGFERLDGFSVPKEDMSAWYLDTPYRFDQKRMNTYDYSIRHGDALSALGIPYDSIEASALVQGTFDLSKYTFIDWILGEESTVDETLSTVEQTLVTEYIAQGGKAFFSGSEIAWDLHFKGSDTDRQFCEQVLGVAFAADDAQTYTLSSGASFTALYDVEYADTFNVVSGEAVWFYDTGAVAGVVNNSVFIAGFPWETVADTADRVSLYAEVIDRLDVPSIPGVDTCDEASQPADDTTACRAGDAECDISVGSDVHVDGIDTDERDAHFIAQDTGKFVDASVRTNPGVPNPDPSCTHLGGITRSSTTLLMLLCALGLLLLGRTTRRGPR